MLAALHHCAAWIDLPRPGPCVDRSHAAGGGGADHVGDAAAHGAAAALSVLVHGAASAVLYRPFKKALPKEGLRMPEKALF